MNPQDMAMMQGEQPMSGPPMGEQPSPTGMNMEGSADDIGNRMRELARSKQVSLDNSGDFPSIGPLGGGMQ